MRALLLAALLLTYATTPGHADTPTRTGLTCGLLTSTDVVGLTANPGTEVGVIWGGPIGAADLPSFEDGVLYWDVAGNPAAVSMRCDVQLTSSFASGPDYLTATSAVTSTATAVVPTYVWYQILPSDPVFLCTTVSAVDARGDSVMAYYDTDTGTFVRDPGEAHCELAISQEVPPSATCGLLPTGCPLDPVDLRVVVPATV